MPTPLVRQFTTTKDLRDSRIFQILLDAGMIIKPKLVQHRRGCVLLGDGKCTCVKPRP